jgi:hypothetical protein
MKTGKEQLKATESSKKQELVGYYEWVPQKNAVHMLTAPKDWDTHEGVELVMRRWTSLECSNSIRQQLLLGSDRPVNKALRHTMRLEFIKLTARFSIRHRTLWRSPHPKMRRNRDMTIGYLVQAALSGSNLRLLHGNGWVNR